VVRTIGTLALGCVRDAALTKVAADHLHQGLACGAPIGREELCSFVWSCCSLGFYHEPLFQAVLGLMSDLSNLPQEALCQLYETHLALKAFRKDSYRRYELKGEVLKSLRSQYKKLKGGKAREVRLERASEKLHKDIADILRIVVEDSVSRQHLTDLGFPVDLAVTRRRGASTVAIVEVDGPHSLLRSLDPSAPQPGHASRLRGGVLLKRNLLQKQGFSVVVVSEELWRNLGDSRERRDLLRDLLKKAGVPKERLQ